MNADTPAEMARNAIRNPRAVLWHLQNRYPYDKRLGVELSSRGLLGTNVFSRDWDVLVVLDTCRVDALRMVAPEYSFLTDIGRICSTGGSSPEWMAATFTKDWIDELQNTAYVVCNGFADLLFEHGGDCDQWDGPCPDDYYWTGHWNFAEESDFGRLEHIRGHELMAGTTPPDVLTDRGIALARGGDFNRTVLHYVQPHMPYVANAAREDRDLYEYERKPWQYLRQGGARELVFGAMLDELRWVLDSIEVLLENIDAETVAITADHGDAFGGFETYGHGVGYLHPKVRFVPWAETSAADTGAYTPDIEASEGPSDYDVAETLRALGYRE